MCQVIPWYISILLLFINKRVKNSGFIFLRWICPAIISPKQFGLVQDHPDTNTCRTLTLIAKCLMTLASHNSTEQSAKELWIMQLNDFAQVKR